MVPYSLLARELHENECFQYSNLPRLVSFCIILTAPYLVEERYTELAQRVDEALGFMAAAGVTVNHPMMNTVEFWTSHECLHLPYEQAMTRVDSTTGCYYDCSAHMLWVGERTRQLDGAHVEFLRGVSNPLGIKVNDSCTYEEINMAVVFMRIYKGNLKLYHFNLIKMLL